MINLSKSLSVSWFHHDQNSNIFLNTHPVQSGNFPYWKSPQLSLQESPLHDCLVTSGFQSARTDVRVCMCVNLSLSLFLSLSPRLSLSLSLSRPLSHPLLFLTSACVCTLRIFSILSPLSTLPFPFPPLHLCLLFRWQCMHCIINVQQMIAWSLSFTADCQRNWVKSFVNSVCCYSRHPVKTNSFPKIMAMQALL